MKTAVVGHLPALLVKLVACKLEADSAADSCSSS
jgi:hypothetical protein